MSITFYVPSTRKGPVGVAVIGEGVISKKYLDNLTVFPDLKVHVIADLFEEAAEARAKEYGLPEWGGVDKALNHPDVELIVNLTIPAAHVEVATAAVKAGKHVWTEKPFSLDRESGLDYSRQLTLPASASVQHRTHSSVPACRPPGGSSSVGTSVSC